MRAAAADAADVAFVRRLLGLHGSRRLHALRRWQYHQVDPAMIEATAGATAQDYLLRAVVAKAFATWHAGRAEARYGSAGTGIGRAMRQVGGAGGFGPRDPGAERAVVALLDAATPQRLAEALDAAMARLRTCDHPPHWETMVRDLRQWHDPATRDEVRLRWGTQFYRTSDRPADID